MVIKSPTTQNLINVFTLVRGVELSLVYLITDAERQTAEGILRQKKELEEAAKYLQRIVDNMAEETRYLNKKSKQAFVTIKQAKPAVKKATGKPIMRYNLRG